jgi:hypothetical protein
MLQQSERMKLFPADDRVESDDGVLRLARRQAPKTEKSLFL